MSKKMGCCLKHILRRGQMRKQLACVVFTVLLSTCITSYANINDDRAAISAANDASKDIHLTEALAVFREHSYQSQKDAKPFVDGVLKSARMHAPIRQKPKATEGALLFVSFSMPEPLLLELADEAHALNIPLVIRGLVDNDFKKTIETFARLRDHAEKQHRHFDGLSVDPLWFAQFHIESVPALVLSPSLSACDASRACDPRFDVVYGNSRLKKGLSVIAERGDSASQLARNILEKGHV
jgi:conjugal transfer pilus assembly protein TrbC